MPKDNYITPEILHDAPLANGEKVDFSFDDYAATISRLIASKNTKTPMAINISGAWGTGKTTLLRRIKSMLDETPVLQKQDQPAILEFVNSKENPQELFRSCRSVWFNAWKYSDEDELLVALIRVILQEMSDDDVISQVFEKLLDPTYPRRDVVGTVLNWFKIKIPGVDIGLDTGEPVPTQLAEKTAILDLFDDAFDRLMAAWVHRKVDVKKINPQNGVLVVFIDDLDRCLPTKMIQVLEVVKLFLDKKGCIFVLGADTGIIQQAILKHYDDAGVTGESAKDYLDKIVQLRFELPPIVEKDMQDYLKKEGVIADGWGDSWKLLLSGANVNPRSVKAFVNDINLQWSMLKNLGRADGVNRADFNAWQLLMRAAPRSFVRLIRERLFTSEKRYEYVLKAMEWANGDSSLGEQFQDYQISYHFQRVLQDIKFSPDFTSTALGAFLHLTTTQSSLGRRMSGKLKVFLLHSSHDKPAVRDFYQRLLSEGWIDPWLDEEKLFPGQDWDLEIERAVDEMDAVIVFLSDNSVDKVGYVQKELRIVLNMAEYKPAGTLFVLPVRLNDCPLPRRLSSWQFVDAFPEDRKDWAYERLIASLKLRAENLGVDISSAIVETAKAKSMRTIAEAKVKGKQAVDAAKANLPEKQDN